MNLIKLNSENNQPIYISAEDISSFRCADKTTFIYMRNEDVYQFPGDITTLLAKAIIASTNGKLTAI